MNHRTACATTLVLVAIAGCFADKRVIDSHRDASADSGLPLPPPGTCTRGKQCLPVEGGTGKVDLLFMIDNSNSMREEQDALLKQMPGLIAALSTGDVDADGTPDFGEVRDLHLGVVSSDMGLPGVAGVDNCSGFGGDGLLQRRPSGAVAGCDPSYPTFISYAAAGNDSTIATAHAFACVATLGTGGCGFEQQLEAPLKALWPSHAALPKLDGSPPAFLADAQGKGGRGHGDTANDGFLRSDPTQGPSVLGVIVISDEDDGSTGDMHHLTPPADLDPSDPLVLEPFNLRNFYHRDKLYPVQRYIDGFKALRPGHEDRVVFGALAGIPPDLVDAAAIDEADRSAKARNAFYDKLLGDSRMKERIDPASMETPGAGNMIPACETSHGKAYPARRIVATARGFGENGFVQSICEDSYERAVAELAKRIGRRVESGCLDPAFTRHSDGRIACDLRLVLKSNGDARSCADLGAGVSNGGKTKASGPDKARPICNVTQLPVKNDQLSTDPDDAGSGWYYDDFSPAAAHCQGQRVALKQLSMQDAEAFLDCD